MRIEWVQECNRCSGYGAYVGTAERGGASVVCRDCSGTGRQEKFVSYREFTGRKEFEPGTIKRVFRANCGIVIHPEATPGGVTYEQWLEDSSSVREIGAELREHTCPAWWYQSADITLKPDWSECQSTLGGRFSSCAHFSTKNRCWARFDEENVKDEG